VIIFGQHSQDWMDALEPIAPVWRLLPNVISVSLANRDTPPFISGNYLQKILRITGFRKTVMIPLMESHLYEMPKGFKSLIAPVKTVQLMGDKSKLTSFLIKNGFSKSVPKIYESNDFVQYPVVIKRTDLNAGQGIRIIQNENELCDALADPIYANQKFMLQECVASDLDFVAHVIAKNGKILWIKSFCYSMPDLFTIRTPGAHMAIADYTLNSNTLDIFKKIIKLLNYSGPCNIDFRVVGDQPKIFEINPRLGGSLMMPENLSELKENLELIITNAT
jgi:carbamoylphosphate synthase large subunit